MNKPENSPQSPKSKRAIVYVLRERLKELTVADSDYDNKSDRQKARAMALSRIALVLGITSVTPANANRRLSEIAKELSLYIPSKELSGFKKIAKYLPPEEIDSGN